MYGFAEELIKIRRNDQADSYDLIYFNLFWFMEGSFRIASIVWPK
jgi:hypothetical protein